MCICGGERAWKESTTETTSLFISLSQIYFLFTIFSLYISFHIGPGRYYRANSVRFPTQPCEGVCSLNHYCAITRIDYREYRQCLETAASALASRSRSINGDMNNTVLLLIIAFIQLLLHQQFVLSQFLLSVAHVQLNIVRGLKTFVSQLKLINSHC